MKFTPSFIRFPIEVCEFNLLGPCGEDSMKATIVELRSSPEKKNISGGLLLSEQDGHFAVTASNTRYIKGNISFHISVVDLCILQFLTFRFGVILFEFRTE
jgi:hypothetical protein